MQSVDLFLVSTIPWESRKTGYGAIDECLPYEILNQTSTEYLKCESDEHLQQEYYMF